MFVEGHVMTRQKCMLSLHTTCSAMHVIKREESVFGSSSGGCLCFGQLWFVRVRIISLIIKK